MKVLMQAADGLEQIIDVPFERPQHEMFRVCMKILRINGQEREHDMTSPMQKRKYVLWTQKEDGTFVYREDL